jgi:hypothetical protein
MIDIKIQMNELIAKKILGNLLKAKEYLTLLDIPQAKSASSAQVWKNVVDSWDYNRSLPIIREMFMQSPKYARGKTADQPLATLRQEWITLGLGEVSWPFSQGDFDGFVQRVNASDNTSAQEKDDQTKLAALKYRRIKEINTYRNDFIETLLFEKNKNILPTLNHRRGVDFYIDGISYDQKVAKSPTAQFKKDYGEDWRQSAIRSPAKVAEYLYRYQDEGRFGADPRLLVVYLDEDVTTDKIREIVDSINIDTPSQITFSFAHKLQGIVEYKVPCFTVLLHN